jgi:hypothetical protein
MDNDRETGGNIRDYRQADLQEAWEDSQSRELIYRGVRLSDYLRRQDEEIRVPESVSRRL